MDPHAPAAGPAGASPLHSLRFQQTFSGRRVLWSQLDVLVSDREVGLIRATVVPVKRGRPAQRAALGRRRALAIARRAAPGRGPARAPQLITYAGTPARGRAPRLAYVVETVGAATKGEDDPSGLCVVVDARTGRVLTTWRGSAARGSNRRIAQTPARARQAGVTPGVRSAPIIRMNDKVAPGPQTEGGPYGFWRSILPQNVLANWQASPTLDSTHVFNADLDAAIRNTKDVVVHMCVTRSFCSRDGTGNPRKPFQLTGNDTISQKGGAFYNHGLERTFLDPFRGYQNDVIAHELGHLIHHVRAADFEFDTIEQNEVGEGIADMFAYDFDREDAQLGEDGPDGKGSANAIRSWNSAQHGEHYGWPTTTASHPMRTPTSTRRSSATPTSPSSSRSARTWRGTCSTRCPGSQVPTRATPTWPTPSSSWRGWSSAHPNRRPDPRVEAAAKQAFLIDAGLTKGPPSCIPAAPPPPPPPPPPSQVAVPDVRGDTPGAASTALSNAGLFLGTQRDVVDNSCNNIGAVLSQTPSAGTVVPLGTSVNITIGQRPAPPRSCP